MKCKKCNEKVLLFEKFCPNCGGKIPRFWENIKIKPIKLPKIQITKEICFIIIALIIAGSYILVENQKLNYKEKIRIEKETSEKIQQDAYESCMKEVEADYSYNWDKACKRLNKKNDCSLPAYNADTIEKWRKEAKTTCLDKLKNKAFKEYEIEE